MAIAPLRTLILTACAAWCTAADPAGNLLANGDAEQGASGWNAWSRQSGDITLAVDEAIHHGGSRALRVQHRGDKDWSLAPGSTIAVSPGEIMELALWLRLGDGGSATLGVVTRDAQGRTLSWDHGGRTCRAAKDWTHVVTRIVIPAGCTTIQPRLIGSGPVTAWCDDAALVRQGSLDALRTPGLPATASAETAALRVVVATANATLAFTDKRTGRTWSQQAGGSPLLVLGAQSVERGLDLRLLDPTSLRELGVQLRLDAERAECAITLRGDGELATPITWPAPMASAAGQILILPVNEGISYPVDDASLSPMHYHLYGGHGLCMPWYGAIDGEQGWMAIVATADDAAVRIPRQDGRLCLAPEWQAQRGAFGEARTIRYVLIDQGGYVAMAKRYRAHAKASGLFRTLADKRAANPNVDLLVGAVNVWCWEKQADRWCRELQGLGITRILWSNALPPDQLAALNGLGVLTSRYDLYQDSMNPEFFPLLRYQHGDWTSDAWKKGDILLMANGDWEKGWGIETKDGTKMIPCGVLCDRQAVPYARERIPAELAKSPYRCRFIDTTTASSWRECWDPRHPMTRSDCKHARMDLLRYISEDCRLVCGSETGHDAAVPYAHYFEGMLSLGPYRVPDSGRDMARIWDEVPAAVATFQTGHRYRLPLWELVYHDCLVAQWYWGDYNNKLPALWDRRDLWNALYGTPPMFMFNRKVFDANRERFVQSYRATAPVARATGYAEMTEHRWLTPDHAVQRSRFANGVTVTVNLGDAPWAMPDGTALPALGRRVEGMRD